MNPLSKTLAAHDAEDPAFETQLTTEDRDVNLDNLKERVEEAPSDVREFVLAYAPVVAVVAGLLAVFSMVGGSLDRSIEEHMSAVSELEAELNTSRQELAELSGKRRVVYGVARQEAYWSDELRLVSDKLPDKAWITQIRVVVTPPIKEAGGAEPTAPLSQTVSIEGGVLSASNEGDLDVIGKLIEDLQADRRFKETFSGITLESVQRTADPYALSFGLTLTFKS